MKKLFALLLVLLIVAPAVGLACSCCQAEKPSQDPLSIGNAHCDCCTTIDPNRENCTLERSEKSSLPATRTLLSPASSLAAFFFLSGILNPEFSSSNTDPPSSSQTSLYLTHRVLRI